MESIIQSLQATQQSNNQEVHKQAYEYQQQLQHNDPNFIITLLDIYDQSDQFTKLQALILVKNVIKRIWISYAFVMEGKDKKSLQFIPEPLKLRIRERVLQYAQTEQTTMFKKEFILILIEISHYDYPSKFKQLNNYFESNLQQIIAALPTQPQLLAASGVTEFLQFFKRVVKGGVSNSNDKEHLKLLWTPLYTLWQHASTLQIQDSNNNSVGNTLDKLITYFACRFSLTTIQEQLSILFTSLLQKCAQLLNKQSLETLILCLQRLQDRFPLGIANGFNDYLCLLQMMMAQSNNQPLGVLKATCMGFIRILKSFEYFCDHDKYACILEGKRTDAGLQQQLLTFKQQIENIFTQFFNQHTISILDQLVQLGSRPQDELSIEDIIEQEDENDFDNLTNPKHSALYSLCLILVELILYRFPAIGVTHVQSYLNLLQQSNYQIDQRTLECVLAIVGLVPRVAHKLKTQMPLQVLPVMDFLKQSNTIPNLRRLAILSNRIILTLEAKDMISLVQMIIQLIGCHNDTIIQYQSLMCIKTMATSYQSPLPWSQILENVAPVVVTLLKNFTKPAVVSPLLQLIQQLIEKSQVESQEVVARAIENSRLFELMNSRLQESQSNQLLIESLCEMIRTLIVTFPIGTALPQIFKMAFQLISGNISPPNLQILQLWHFLILEHQESSLPLNDLVQLYSTYKVVLLRDTDYQIASRMMLIVEEYILIGAIPTTEFPLYVIEMEKRYLMASNLKHQDHGNLLKNACLSLTSTMVLCLLNLNQNQELAMFQSILGYLITDLQSQAIKQMDNKFRIELQIASILSRFILQDSNGFVNMLAAYQVSCDVFFTHWLNAFQYIESAKAKKLNILAVLQFLRYISVPKFTESFDTIVFHFQATMTKLNAPPKQKLNLMATGYRLSLYRSSARSDQLRDTQLYSQFDMGQFCQQQIGNYLREHGITDDRMHGFIKQ